MAGSISSTVITTLSPVTTNSSNETSTIFPTSNTTLYSTSIPLNTTETVTSHDVIFKLGITIVIFGALFFCTLAFILALWFTKQKIKASFNRQQSSRNYTYDNQVDILHTETSDSIALEKAFGTGVLVIQDSPIVRQKERLTTGTGTGPTNRSGYMSTAESDTEHLNV